MRIDFQSPVLGAFLCFTIDANRLPDITVALGFQSPVLGAFLCFSMMLRKSRASGMTFNPQF